MKTEDFFEKLDLFFSQRILKLSDYLNDLRICRRSLEKYENSVFRDDKRGIGFTGSESTHYIVLNRIFSRLNIEPEDRFIDIGCGKGRVLACMVSHRYSCSISGVEINEVSAKVAREWTALYPQIRIIQADAFDLELNEYTVFFLSRPFLPQTFEKFIRYLEHSVDHQIQLIYWVDQHVDFLLNGRPGWKLLGKEKLTRIHGLRIGIVPQGYTVLTFSPVRSH